MGRVHNYDIFSTGGLRVGEICRCPSLVFGSARFSPGPFFRKEPRGKRTFHYIAVVILTVSSLTYFAMASNLGETTVRTEFRLSRADTRSVFVGLFPS